MKKICICFGILLIFTRVSAQSDAVISGLILEKDSLFWKAYNSCDLAAMKTFFSSDLEFYHDKGGLTFGVDKMVKSFGEGPCSPKGDYRLLREAVPGSVKVYTLRQADTVYGAIIQGSHYFSIVKNGQTRRDGLAQFTHVWMKKGGWKMTRVLSFDHGPAPYDNGRKVVELTAKQLESSTGTFKGPQTTLVFTAGNNMLIMQTPKNTINLYPQSADVFFMKEADLTFTFTRDADGRPVKLEVHERGGLAETLTPQR
ncbi:nuclear transport factor 2 family protein [Chitinophaga sp. NPDC101104]|uniref:nuclear transport factor 2 family protein n=1 Tax=Chitinophaga sp. NPDC101104 TaxID=3390561 RepID=UPI003D041CAF